MKSFVHLVTLCAGLVLMLHVSPSWGGPPNPTASDDNLNTAGGSRALANVNEDPSTGGFFNTAFGYDALNFNTTGSNNTATGISALLGNTTGISNTAAGAYALVNNSTGNNNTASGDSALHSSFTGSNNTAAGFQALSLNGAGAGNTAVGAKALKKSTGTKNIGIGYQAGVTLQTGNNNIYIGHQGAGNESQAIRIGTAQAKTFIAGITGAIVSGTTVEIDTTTGQLGVVPSSARYKQDIASMGTRSEKVLQLRPVTFAYKEDVHGITHYGLIAEEVATVLPELVTRTATGEVQTVKYQELIPMLLNELQRQQQAIKRQEQELAEMSALRKEMAELRALVGQGREMAASSR